MHDALCDASTFLSPKAGRSRGGMISLPNRLMDIQPALGFNLN
jgi:hypothetical protein